MQITKELWGIVDINNLTDFIFVSAEILGDIRFEDISDKDEFILFIKGNELEAKIFKLNQNIFNFNFFTFIILKHYLKHFK